MPEADILSAKEIEKRFKTGREELKLGNFYEAQEEFSIISEKTAHLPEKHNLYNSYLALTEVMLGETASLRGCRRYAHNEHSNCETLCNLALAEIKCNQRKKALDAVSRCMKIDPENKRAKAILAKIDTRRKPIIPFLKRSNSLNKILGKISYKTNNKNHNTIIKKYSSTSLHNFIL